MLRDHTWLKSTFIGMNIVNHNIIYVLFSKLWDFWLRLLWPRLICSFGHFRNNLFFKSLTEAPLSQVTPAIFPSSYSYGWGSFGQAPLTRLLWHRLLQLPVTRKYLKKKYYVLKKKCSIMAPAKWRNWCNISTFKLGFFFWSDSKEAFYHQS